LRFFFFAISIFSSLFETALVIVYQEYFSLYVSTNHVVQFSISLVRIIYPICFLAYHSIKGTIILRLALWCQQEKTTLGFKKIINRSLYKDALLFFHGLFSFHLRFVLISLACMFLTNSLATIPYSMGIEWADLAAPALYGALFLASIIGIRIIVFPAFFFLPMLQYTSLGYPLCWKKSVELAGKKGVFKGLLASTGALFLFYLLPLLLPVEISISSNQPFFIFVNLFIKSVAFLASILLTAAVYFTHAEEED
jgi:hypothetical protein